jgi:hypothetical protein
MSASNAEGGEYLAPWSLPDMPSHPPPVLERTSGVCARCDARFSDEIVARYPAPALPGGVAHVELRHLAGSVSVTCAPPGQASLGARVR